MQRLRILAACLTLTACAAAEASDDDSTEFSSDALVEGHGGIEGPVKVEATRLVIQRAGNEALLGSAGRVLVGKPQNAVTNPYGFLRRAVSAEVLEDGHIAINTEEASLGDAVQTGSVHANHDLEPSAMRIVPMSNGSGVSSGKGLDVTIGETTLLDFHTNFKDPTRLLPVNSFDISRTVKLTHAQVHFEPSVDLSLSIRHGKIDTFNAMARGEISASFALSVDTKTSIDIDRNAAYRDTLKAHLRQPTIKVTLFQTEPYILPIQWIGFVPVIETVRFRVLLECDIDIDSQMHMDAGAEMKSTAAFGVSYRNGEWQPLEKPTFSATPTFAMTHKGSVAGICGIRSELGFFFYDLVGPTLSITPYTSFDVATSPRGFDFVVTPGIRGAFGGRFNVLGYELLRTDVVLFDTRSQSPFKGSFGL
jgi:hypothetical protein